MEQEPHTSPSPFAIWLWAARPRTLPLAASAIVLGFGQAVMAGSFRWGVFLLALVTALLLQILSNLANDYGDAVSGADNSDRVGPLRVVAGGLTSPERMFRAVLLAAFLAAVSGVCLVLLASWGDWRRFVFFMILGTASILAAILYTVGKRPYGYIGLGDFMAGFFFGPVAVWGSAVLCGMPPDFYSRATLLLPGLAAGFCSSMVLNVNNLRDIETDKRSGKMTVAARLGVEGTRRYHCTLAALVLLCWAVFWIGIHPACLAGLLFALPLIRSVLLVAGHSRDAAVLNAQLKNTVIGSALLNTGMAFLCMLI